MPRSLTEALLMLRQRVDEAIEASVLGNVRERELITAITDVQEALHPKKEHP